MRLKRTFSLSILPLALLAGCCSDHEALEKQNAAILAEMKKINARLERLEKQSRQNRMNTQTFVSRSVPADRSKLSQIRKLPEKPTDAQIVEYIRQIGEATAGQTLFSPRGSTNLYRDQKMVARARIEPATTCLEGRCSIH